jgi:hypothetical protein
VTAGPRHGRLRRATRVAIPGLFALALVAGSAAAIEHKSVRRPDLVMWSLASPPEFLAPGASFTSRLTVANVGRARSARSSVRAYLSRDSRKGKGDVLLASASGVPTLKRGKAVSRRAVLRVPSATATGLWFLIACADDSRRIREKNERNNCRAAAKRTSLVQTVGASPPPPFPPPPAPPPSPPPSVAPTPIAGQGYAKTFGDEFDVFSGGNWGEGTWYDPGSPANAIFVQAGVLHLVSRRSQGYPNITVTTEGGSDPKVFQYGYMEARMSWTAGNGAWPAFWLLSYRHTVNPSWPNINPFCAENLLPAAECYSAEIDVFEGQGSEPSTFYNTIHKNSCSCYGVDDEQNADNDTTGVEMSGFHTYAVLWTADEMEWYLDENLIYTEKASNSELNGRIFAALRQPQLLLFDMYTGGWTKGPDSSTPDELHTEVDWVRVWQK